MLDQVVLLLQRVFNTSDTRLVDIVVRSSKRPNIVGTLFDIHRLEAISAFAARAIRKIIDDRLLIIAREKRSLLFVCMLGQELKHRCHIAHPDRERLLRLFVPLDKFVVEMCQDLRGIQGYEEEQVREWCAYRSEVVSFNRWADDHFNVLHGVLPINTR